MTGSRRDRASFSIAASALAALAIAAAWEDAALAAAPCAASVRPRRNGRFSSLSGAWSGAYRYPQPLFGVREVPFNMVIVETGGAFTGDCDEPDMRPFARGGRVTSSIAGVRRGGDVSFTKQMDGSGGMRHRIFYAGRVNDALTRIEGTWTIPGAWDGTFFMERAGVGAEEAASRAAGAEE